jgi:hypothetical protein
MAIDAAIDSFTMTTEQRSVLAVADTAALSCLVLGFGRDTCAFTAGIRGRRPSRPAG